MNLTGLRTVATVNIVILAFFTVVYYAMDMSRHFNFTAPQERGKLLDAVYFGTLTHAATGLADVTPRTAFAKLVITLHATVAWMSTILLIFLL